MIYKMIWILSGLTFLSATFVEYDWSEVDSWMVKDYRNPDYDPNTLLISDQFDSAGNARGLVTENEISGIEISTRNENRLWAINDSGNGPYLFLMDAKTAGILSTYHLPKLTNIDWEDISLGNGIFGESTLYIGDIGNNLLNRSRLQIYIMEEPDYLSATRKNIQMNPEYMEINFMYPDGPHNAEALFVDDITREIYIITKENNRSRVYLLPYPRDPGETHTLTYLGSLPFPLAVAADYHPESKLLMVKTYDRIYLWENKENKKLSDLIFDTPMCAPYYPVEMQGESLSIGNKGYYTLSERVMGIDPVLYFYGKKE